MFKNIIDIKKKLVVLTFLIFSIKRWLSLKKSLKVNKLKYPYQKQLISDLDISTRNGQNLLKISFKSFH